MDAVLETKEPIHEFFGLTYSSYLCLPRSVLQSMPVEWQERFLANLNEISDCFGTDWEPEGGYWVQARDGNGQFATDSYSNYERGRRRIGPAKSQ